MRQIFQIIPGGKTFVLKNEGKGTCAVSYQGAVVMIGGAFPAHGKVDGWEVNNNILFPISLSDTTLKATTSTLYPTFLRQDIITPAPRSHLQMEEKRFDSKICIISLYFPRACWSPEVTMIGVNVSQARSCTCRQRRSGPEGEIFPGIPSKSYQQSISFWWWSNHDRPAVGDFSYIFNCVLTFSYSQLTCLDDFFLLSAVFCSKYESENY